MRFSGERESDRLRVFWCGCLRLRVNLTNHSPPTRSHPPSRSIPQRCVATGWWPRHFQPALSLPAAPAAPVLSSAVCLQKNMKFFFNYTIITQVIRQRENS